MTDKKKTEELKEAELDQVTGGAGSHDHLTGHNWQLEIEGVTQRFKDPAASHVSGDVVIKGKNILEN